MFPDKIFDVWASIYTTISTFKAVNPSIYVRKCRSTPSHWDLENQKNTKGSPLWKWKKFLSPILMKFKTCNPYGLRISHTKFEWNRRQKIFLIPKGGPFGVFPIFKVSMSRCWTTFTDINGGTDSLECWNSGVNGCLNIKNFIWRQVLDVSTTFCWVI